VGRIAAFQKIEGNIPGSMIFYLLTVPQVLAWPIFALPQALLVEQSTMPSPKSLTAHTILSAMYQS
jgi:hypothetical protein